MIPGLGRCAGEGIVYSFQYSWASLTAQLVKNTSAMQETWIQSLGWEDPLEKGKAIHSSYSAIKINLATCNSENESSKKVLKQITEEYL